MVDLQSIPALVNGLCIRELGDITLIISEKGDELHSLDDIGGFIWNMIDGKRKVADIVDCVFEEYDVERSSAERDIIYFVKILFEKQLISIGAALHGTT